MGTTLLPAALIVDEVNKTNQFINNYYDIVLYHFDEGITYQVHLQILLCKQSFKRMFSLRKLIQPLTKGFFKCGGIENL
jgi:hypothetical protein